MVRGLLVSAVAIVIVAATACGGDGDQPNPPAEAQAAGEEDCDPSYLSHCIPVGHEDYDCAGGGGNGPNFIEGPVEVVPPDPHRLDPDGDGVGCESSAEPPEGAEGFTVYFLDVGQGDATLILTDGGASLLIDGGRSKATIRDRLNALGVVSIDAVLATHADADHIAGLVAVLDDLDVETVYWNGQGSDTLTFGDFEALWPEDGVIELTRDDSFELGTLEVQVLHPGDLSGDSNEDSIVLLVQCGEVQLLLMGDAEEPSETSMIGAGVLMQVDVLKVGHHGSRTSTSPEFLEIVQPEFAVISAGRNTQYGHPHQETLDALDGAGAQVLRTDTTADPDGVTMTTDCAQIDISES